MKQATTQVEVVTAAEAKHADLRTAAERINQSIELIKGHEDAFEDATLEHRLIIGLEIARAQQIFGISKAEAGAIGGSKTQRDMLASKPSVLTSSPIGFANWLAKEIPDLKRPTAIKYATAFQALGLKTDATPARIKSKLKDLRHQAGKTGEPMPTLSLLYRQGKPAKTESLKIEPPKDSKQLRLEDARELFHLWEEQGRKLIENGTLDDLDKKGLEKVQEFQLWLRDRLKARLKGL